MANKNDPVEIVRQDGRTIFTKMHCRSCGVALPDSELFANCCTDCYVEEFGGPKSRRKVRRNEIL